MPRTDAPTAPWDRRIMRQEQAAEQRPGSMLGRRDVALVPWLALLAIAGSIAIGTVLRGPAGYIDDGALALAIFAAGVGAAGAGVALTPFGSRFRATVGVYAGFVCLVTVALAALGLHDHGLDTVGFGAAMPLAAYAGLVLPRGVSRVIAAAIVAVAATIAVAVPDKHALDAVLTVLLIATGWLIGLFSNLAHARVARVSRMLASFDRVARALNRRGFLEQLDAVLGRPSGSDTSIALLLVDIPDFSTINFQQGRGAGDELIGWIGTTLPGALPPTAEVGRLDSDQYAVLLTGVTVDRALAVADAIGQTLRPRATPIVGVATSQTLSVAADDLVRVAEAALTVAREAGTAGSRVRHLVAGTTRMADPSRVRLRHSADAPLSYAHLRTNGRLPRVPESGAVYSRMIMQGLLMIAASGAAVIAATWVSGGHTIYDDIIRYAGAPWVLWLLGLTWLSRSHGIKIEGLYHWVLFVGNTLALSIGVGLAMLAHGGIVAPIAAALYLKVLFDAAVTPPRRAAVTLAITIVGWIVVAVLSPSSTLWAAPLCLTLLACSYAIGSVGHRAFDAVTAYSQSLAGTDPLTRAANRVAFDAAAERAIAAARDARRPLVVLSIDLDDFGQVNRREGHAVGDERLCQIARALDDAFPEAHSVGRVSGDGFAVVLSVGHPDEAEAAADRARDRLGEITPVSTGYAGFPADAADLDGLLLRAAQRREAQRDERRPRRLDSAA